MFWVVDKTFAEKCAEWDAEDAAKYKRRIAELEEYARQLESEFREYRDAVKKYGAPEAE